MRVSEYLARPSHKDTQSIEILGVRQMTTSLLMNKLIRLADTRRWTKSQESNMSGQVSERRQDFRRESSERLFVQVIAAQEADLVGTTISCNALDMSANGLKIESPSLIPAGTKLDIWVDMASKPGKFFLTSDVRWSRTNEQGNCEFGVQLHDGATTDIEQWRENHS